MAYKAKVFLHMIGLFLDGQSVHIHCIGVSGRWRVSGRVIGEAQSPSLCVISSFQSVGDCTSSPSLVVHFRGCDVPALDCCQWILEVQNPVEERGIQPFHKPFY